MSRDPQRLLDYLGHMLQAIDRIQRYTDDLGEAGFLQNEMAQDAVVRNLEIIGEAPSKTRDRPAKNRDRPGFSFEPLVAR